MRQQKALRWSYSNRRDLADRQWTSLIPRMPGLCFARCSPVCVRCPWGVCRCVTRPPAPVPANRFSSAACGRSTGSMTVGSTLTGGRAPLRDGPSWMISSLLNTSVLSFRTRRLSASIDVGAPIRSRGLCGQRLDRRRCCGLAAHSGRCLRADLGQLSRLRRSHPYP